MAGSRSPKDADAVEVARCRRGDREAFRALFDRHREQTYRLAYRMVGNKEDALDLTQEAFIKAFGSLDRFREQASFKTYLTRIAVNACLDFRRRSKPPLVALDEDQVGAGGPREAARAKQDDPATAAETKELEEAFRDAVAALPEAQRTTFLLHTVEGLTYREVAEAVGVAVGTVMSRIYYARRHIQESVGPLVES